MKPPSLLFLLGGLGMMLVAVVAVLLVTWDRRPQWKAVGIGAGAWTLSVALKFAWAVPMNGVVRHGLDHILGTGASAPVYWLYVGLLTGIFECGIALLFVRRSHLRSCGWDGAVAFGTGFGAMEAFAVGAVSAISLLASVIFFDALPAEAKAALLKSYSSLAVMPLAIVERITALMAHIFSCVLIVVSVKRAQWRWFWLSFAYKTLLDAVAAWAILAFGVRESVARLAQAEAIFAVFALVAVVQPRSP